jgi:hypothetical protein
MTSIGGLLSLWLGISALDLRAVVEVSIGMLKNIIMQFVWICFVNEYFQKFGWFILKIVQYLNFFKKFYLKKITIILSLICFIYQSIQLTLEFTEFKTTISVEFIHDLNFSYYPAYSLCTYLRLKNDSKRLNAKFPEMIEGSNIQERNISKYLILAKNTIFNSMHQCLKDKEDNKECIRKSVIIMSYSNLGQCHTLSPLRYPISEESKFIRDVRILNLNSQYFPVISKILEANQQILIHDPSQFPSLTFTDNAFDFSATKFKRLPPPYDSKCFDYENSKLFKSRGQCINDCVFKKILNKYDCIPRDSANVLTLYDNITLDSTFCVDNNFENFSEDDCSDRCLKPCEEIIFTSYQTELNIPLGDFVTKSFIYINKIYMTFIYFISSIGGLLGLWNNVSVYDLQLIIMKICGKIFKLKLIRKLSKYIFSANILKSFDLIRSFVIKINLKVKNIYL